MDVARALAGARAGPDPEEKNSQLRGLGFTEEQIAEWWAQKAPSGDAIDVLRDAFPVVQVYQRCHWTIIAGPAGAAFIGIAAQEIETVANALGIPVDTELLDGIRTMTEAAAPLLNKRK